MNNIKKARENAGMSQKEVAISLNVSAPTVSEWESGKKNPSIQNAKELSKLFHVPTDYILGVSEEKMYPSYISEMICDDVAQLIKNDSISKNGSFFIPKDIINKILNRTYLFSNVTFPQFENLIGKTIDDYYLSYAKKAAIDVVDDDLQEYLDELRNRPEKRMLFSVTKNATKSQIEAIVKMIEEMKGDQ